MALSDDDYGPAMGALNERQRKFVMAMLLIPGCSHARAAREAGYSDVKEGAKVRGHYAAHNPKIQEAIREEAGRRLSSLSVIAANVMMDVMLDARSERKDKIKAAAMVLDRTGFAATQNINVNKTVTDTTDRGLEDRIRRAAGKLAQLGHDPARFLEALAGPATAVDAEFTEVKDGQ